MDKLNKIFRNKIVISALGVIALIDTAFAIDYFTTDHEARACIGTQYDGLLGCFSIDLTSLEIVFIRLVFL